MIIDLVLLESSSEKEMPVFRFQLQQENNDIWKMEGEDG